MGHALTAKLLYRNVVPKVEVSVDTCQGLTSWDGSKGGPRTKYAEFLVTVGGPVAGVAFEVAKIAAGLAFAVLFPPLGIPVGLALGAGAAVWLFGETMYALCGTEGDWVKIKSEIAQFCKAKLSSLKSTNLPTFLD